jgi:hypothetical protein
MTPMHYHAREVIFVTYNKVNYLSNMNLWWYGNFCPEEIFRI